VLLGDSGDASELDQLDVAARAPRAGRRADGRQRRLDEALDASAACRDRHPAAAGAGASTTHVGCRRRVGRIGRRVAALAALRRGAHPRRRSGPRAAAGRPARRRRTIASAARVRIRTGTDGSRVAR